MAKQKPSTSTRVARIIYALDQRRTQVYIPFLQARIAELEEKTQPGQPTKPGDGG